MKSDSDENHFKKEPNLQIDLPSKLPSISIQENQSKPIHNSPSKKEQELILNKEKSLSSIKLKITEHQEIRSKENLPELPPSSEEQKSEQENLLFPNDFYSEESKKSSPKIIDGKEVININEIIGEETEQILSLDMIDDNSISLPVSKISSKAFGLITSYAANTFKGIVRDYNEDRVSIVINLTKPKFINYNGPWPKIAYFGVFDGHAGSKCVEYLRNNLLNYIMNNSHFPNNIPSAIKHGFKKIDEDYLTKHAFVSNKLEDNSGSCGLILLLVNNIIYIANVGDSRCVGSFKNGKLLKDITLDHKPNAPYERERILKNGGKIYQTQTPIDDDESFKDKILVGPYRVFPGKLSVSRTIGDAEGKIENLGGNPNVLIPEPDIYTFDLEKDDVDFFVLGCDGIYDQLTSKEILNCAWMVLNNNLDLYKKKLEGKKEKSGFKGNYGDEINMSTSSGNIVDLILKASMIRKSFDNVTCLFISFKNLFENVKIIRNEIDNHLLLSKEILLRNKSNIENINNNIQNELFPEKSSKQKSIKVEKDDDDLLYKNSYNLRRIKSPFPIGKKAIRINSLPKQAFSNINANKNKLDDNVINISTAQHVNKNMTVNNIITYNNNIILNGDNSNTNINTNLNNIHNNLKIRGNSFNEKIINNHHNINIINSPIIKGAINKNNNNFLINTNNQVFFTKMRITGINSKKNKKELSVNNNNYNRINIDNNEDNNQNRNSSYNKNIRPILIENKNDIKDLSNKEKLILAIPNVNNNAFINKHITFKKLNEAEYNRTYGNKKGKEINLTNNIKSSTHMNQDLNLLNMKPLVLKTDKFQQNNNNNLNNNKINITSKNFGPSKMNNKGIKFNNIIKVNTFGINNYKVKNLQNMNINLKNIKLKKLKTDEIKIRKPMPTLTGNVTLGKNNKFFEENNYVKQRRFVTNDNVGRRSNLSEHKKYGIGNNKMELSLTKKNTSEFDKKLLLLNNIK